MTPATVATTLDDTFRRKTVPVLGRLVREGTSLRKAAMAVDARAVRARVLPLLRTRENRREYFKSRWDLRASD